MPWPRRNTGSRLRYGSETTGPAVSTASASSNKASGRRHRHLRISRRNPARSASAFPPAGWHDCSCHPILNATAAAFSGRSFPDLREGGGRTRCSRLPRQHRSKHRDRPLHHGTDANTRYSTPCVTLVKTQDLCVSRNTHSRYLELADDRRRALSIVLVGDQIPAEYLLFEPPRLCSRNAPR